MNAERTAARVAGTPLPNGPPVLTEPLLGVRRRLPTQPCHVTKPQEWPLQDYGESAMLPTDAVVTAARYWRTGMRGRAPSGKAGYTRRYRIDWDAIGTVVAALIGLIAIAVSAYTAHDSHRQLQAQVWPYVSVGWTDALPSGVRGSAGTFDGGGLFARNDGVGPAVVERVEVLLGGRPQPDWAALFKTFGYAGQPGATSWLNGHVFAPGQEIYVLEVLGRKQWDEFKRREQLPLVVRTCYCSTLGDCWVNNLDDSLPINRRTRPVKSCASAIPDKDEFAG